MIIIGLFIIGDDPFLEKCLLSLHNKCNHRVNCEVRIHYLESSVDYIDYLDSRFKEFTFIKQDNSCNWGDITNIFLEIVYNDYKYKGVLLLNSDTTVIHLPNELFMSEGLYQNSIIGGIQMQYDNHSRRNSYSMNMFGEKNVAGRFLNCHYVQGACMYIPRIVIAKVGYINTLFELFYEETEYCYRARLFGINVVTDFSLIISHYEGGTWSRDQKLKYRRDTLYLRNQMLFEVIVDQKSMYRVLFNQLANLLTKKDSLSISLFAYASALFQAAKPSLLKDSIRKIYS